MSDERDDLREEIIDALWDFPLHDTHRSVRMLIADRDIMPTIDRLLEEKRNAYADGMKVVCLLVEEWYDNHCNNISQDDLMVALGRLVSREMHEHLQV